MIELQKIRAWFVSLLTEDSAKPKAEQMSGDVMLANFTALLNERMAEYRAPISAAFSDLFSAELPDKLETLHIEVFHESPSFSFRVFSMDSKNNHTEEPPALGNFYARIETSLPFIADDELGQFMIWEHDPKFGRQVALEQPLDNLNVPEIAIPWFKQIVSETKGTYSRKVAVRVHDLTYSEQI